MEKFALIIVLALAIGALSIIASWILYYTIPGRKEQVEARARSQALRIKFAEVNKEAKQVLAEAIPERRAAIQLMWYEAAIAFWEKEGGEAERETIAQLKQALAEFKDNWDKNAGEAEQQVLSQVRREVAEAEQRTSELKELT